MSPNQKKQPRTVFIDAACHNQLRLLYRKQIFCYGLALGVPSASGPDYVVHLAITTTKGDEVAKLPPYMKAEDYVKIMPPQKEPRKWHRYGRELLLLDCNSCPCLFPT